MPLVNTTDMLNHAYRHGYAICSFNLINLEFLDGVLLAAESCRAPIILSFSEPHQAHYNVDLLVAAAIAGAKRATIPVAISFDHASSIDKVQAAIGLGCNSVMLDVSALPLDENIRATAELTRVAHANGVAVEGKLGYVPTSLNEDANVTVKAEISLTLPAEAKAYVERTEVDSLAITIGTHQGVLGSTPKLDIQRLSKINEAVGIPLVIHGGTGLTDDQFRKLVANGVAKVTYYTTLANVAVTAIRNQLAAHKNSSYLALNGVARAAISMESERIFKLLGSGGRAAEVLTQCRPCLLA
ncbi:MAG: class II fructose-bisphosphate aldolase [Betaproteobacteria bacterium]|nr:class II fructose-bisphosphate aldolase [Betaproteobacteria bacterium]